jgi:hypothetical protein
MHVRLCAAGPARCRPSSHSVARRRPSSPGPARRRRPSSTGPACCRPSCCSSRRARAHRQPRAPPAVVLRSCPTPPLGSAAAGEQVAAWGWPRPEARWRRRPRVPQQPGSQRPEATSRRLIHRPPSRRRISCGRCRVGRAVAPTNFRSLRCLPPPDLDRRALPRVVPHRPLQRLAPHAAPHRAAPCPATLPTGRCRLR